MELLVIMESSVMDQIGGFAGEDIGTDICPTTATDLRPPLVFGVMIWGDMHRLSRQSAHLFMIYTLQDGGTAGANGFTQHGQADAVTQCSDPQVILNLNIMTNTNLTRKQRWPNF